MKRRWTAKLALAIITPLMAELSLTRVSKIFSRAVALLPWASGLLLGATLGLACTEPGGNGDCSPGTTGCACIAGECYTGLDCLAGFCIDAGGETGDGDPDSGDGDGDNPCDGGQAYCGGKCIDTQTNTLHCGGCNMPCADGDGCFAGECVQSCANASCEGFSYCDPDSQLCLPGCDYDDQCDFTEQCDLSEHTCVCGPDYVLCGGECIYFNDPCADNCGNGVIDPGEVCDGSNVDGYTCGDFGWEGGTLGCQGDCSDFSEANCSNATCGDGIVDPPEQCDGVNLDGETCVSQGFVAGTLACSGSCLFNTNGCTNQADDGDCCTINVTPGCEVPAIEMCVCMMDNYCCMNDWDMICVGLATNSCNASCP